MALFVVGDEIVVLGGLVKEVLAMVVGAVVVLEGEVIAAIFVKFRWCRKRFSV